MITVAMAKTTGVVHAFPEKKDGTPYRVSACRPISREFCHPEVQVDEARAPELSTCPKCKERVA
jgi:hypothetical protein